MSSFVSILLKLHLPHTLWNIPLIHTIFVGKERIFLSIFLCIPLHDVLVQVSIHIFHGFLVVAGGGNTLQAVAGHGFVNIARWVVDRVERVEWRQRRDRVESLRYALQRRDVLAQILYLLVNRPVKCKSCQLDNAFLYDSPYGSSQ